MALISTALLFLVMLGCWVGISDCQSSLSLMGCTYFRSPLLVNASSLSRTIQIPIHSGTKYRPNQHCEWRIKGREPGKIVQVTVEKCNIEGPDWRGDCNSDYLDFYDVQNGHNVYQQRLCSAKAEGKVLESSANEMMIQFISNTIHEFDGFRLRYRMVSKTEPSDSSSDSALVSVVVPVVLLLLLLLVVFVFCIVRRQLFKRSTTRQQQQQQQHTSVRNPSSSAPHYTPALQFQSSTSTPHPPAVPSWTIDATDRMAASTMAHTDHHGHVIQSYPLQVCLPDASNSNSSRQEEGRSATPPPSYDYLVRHEGLLGPAFANIPLRPPEYDSVVKDDQMDDPETVCEV